jgi:hypothetical protein
MKLSRSIIRIALYFEGPGQWRSAGHHRNQPTAPGSSPRSWWEMRNCNQDASPEMSCWKPTLGESWQVLKSEHMCIFCQRVTWVYMRAWASKLYYIYNMYNTYYIYIYYIYTYLPVYTLYTCIVSMHEHVPCVFRKYSHPHFVWERP